MERFDVAVVGAGPAGSATAYHLASAGASVLLLDRERFPRDKPCGGGVTLRAAHRLNVGVGGWEADAPRLRDALCSFARANRLGPLESVRGYRLPVGDPSTSLARGRALVVGDAAGLVDPLSGDGIYEAFLSARLAADGLLDFLAGRAASLEPYTAGLRATLARTLANSWTAKRALDRFPRTTYTLASTRPVQRALERLARGDPQSRRVAVLGRLARLSSAA